MSLYKRAGSKYWWMKFTFDGNLVQRSTGVAGKRDASMVESGYRTQLAMGKVGIELKKEIPTFEKSVKDYLEWSKVEHLQKPNSYARIEYSCETLKKFFGKVKVNRIEREDVEKFILKRSGEISKKTGLPITRGTINLELVALKSIFKRLVSAKILKENPAQEIKQLAENERRFHVLSEREENLYLMACPQPLVDVAMLMLETGMRPVEIYELRRQNAKPEKGYLQIENSKTKSSNRRVWLSDKATAVLRRRMKKFKGEYLFPKGDRDFELPTYQLNTQHQAALKSCGLKFRLYDLRHTFATRALENKVDLLTLASMLGHVGLDEVTRYAHPSEMSKSEAVRRMQKRDAKAA